MKTQFLRNLRGDSLIPVSQISRLTSLSNGNIIAHLIGKQDESAEVIAKGKDVQDAAMIMQSIGKAIAAGVPIANEPYCDNYTFAQIIPAQPLWFAAYVWGGKVDYLPLVGWGLIACSNEVVPLIYDDHCENTAEDNWVQRADEYTPSQYLGLVGPRTLRANFEEANAEPIKALIEAQGGDK